MSSTQPDLYEYPAPRETTFKQRIACVLGMHVWTSRTDMGLTPDKDRIDEDLMGYFWEFATPVCKYCPRQLPPWNT